MNSRSGDRDGGVTTVFVAMFAVAVLGMVGLVYEGGRYLEAKRAARHAAVGAARAGAQELDEGSIRGGADFNRLDEGRARERACGYLATVVDEEYGVSCGSDGTRVDARVEGITVQVTIEVDTPLLSGFLGWDPSRTVTEEGHACAEAGITEAGDTGEGGPDPLCD